MELMIKMSAAEADEAMAKGLIQALVYPFSCREEVRKAAEKSAKKAEEVKNEEPKEEQKPTKTERKPVETEQKPTKTERKPVETEQKPVETEQKAPEAEPAEKEKPNYTLDQLSKAAADLITSDAGKQTALLELLHKFSIESMPELKAEDYPAFAEGLRVLGGNL